MQWKGKGGKRNYVGLGIGKEGKEYRREGKKVEVEGKG